MIIQKNIIKRIKPKNITELTKIYSLINGINIWENNVEKLIEEHNINEIACCRDDIYLFLLNKEIDKETCFNIAQFIRRGKLTKSCHYLEQWKEYYKVMNEHNVPIWYINSLKQIKYLSCKSNSYHYAFVFLWLAWYKTYYSKEFNMIITTN